MRKLRPREENDLPKVMSQAGYRAGVRTQEPAYSSYNKLETHLRTTHVKSPALGPCLCLDEPQALQQPGWVGGLAVCLFAQPRVSWSEGVSTVASLDTVSFLSSQSHLLGPEAPREAILAMLPAEMAN